MLFKQEFKPTFPGLVGIAANIDAAALERLPSFDIRNSHIDIQDQVTDLLHPGHDGALRAVFFGEINLAPVAGINGFDGAQLVLDPALDRRFCIGRIFPAPAARSR